MLISPRTAIEQGWITHPKYKTIEDFEKNDHISPNAFDFTVDKMFKVDTTKQFLITNNKKTMRKTIPIEPETLYEESYPNFIAGWWLQPDSVYDVMSEFYVNLPEGIASQLVIRSTLSRNGVLLSSGLYDSFFQGNIGCCLHIPSGAPGFLEQGLRIGQISFHTSDKGGKYKGGYNTEEGQHWTEAANAKT